MLKKLIVLFVLVALALSAASAMAFFPNIPTSPRSRAMGESGVAVFDANYATVMNPAHLGLADAYGATASVVKPFSTDFANLYHMGGAAPLGGKFGGLGISMTQLKVEYDGVDLEEETHLSVAYGHSVYEGLHSSIAFGGSVNMYSVEQGVSVSDLEPGSASTVGFDVGLAMTLHKRTHIGVLIKNMNNPMIGLDEEELGHRLIAGISYQPYDGVITTFEFDNELGEDVQYHGGVEMVVAQGLSLRTGIVTNPNKLTAGFGYSFMGMSLDYGFSTGGGVLDYTHQFGLNYNWGGETQ
jgi:hypothetical protein